MRAKKQAETFNLILEFREGMFVVCTEIEFFHFLIWEYIQYLIYYLIF